MSNYQLARTNTYIGGQLKLDLTLNKGSDELYVEDFHMSPVSNYTGYAWGTDSELLNNRHSENISDYYAKTKNFFFEDCLNPALDTKYPIYSPNYPIDTHDNDCLMGLYRLDRKTYGKSYGFFCPFWITDPTKFLDTKFVFKVFKYRNINPVDDVVYSYTEEDWTEIFKEEYSEESDEQIAQRVATKLQELENNPIKVPVCRTPLNMHELAGKAFHNKFVKYFNEYMQGFASHEYDIKEKAFKSTNVTSDAYTLNFNGQKITQKKTKIEETKTLPFLSNDLAYISFKNGQAWVKGIDPATGAYSNKDISYICSTLLERERPLMDNDYYLARIFKDNSIIAQQLINFNFIFDFADIVPANIYEEMQYTRFGVEVYMYQKDDNDELHRIPLKDFYSNYEYIPMTYVHSHLSSDSSTDLYIDYISGEDPVVNRNVLDYKNNVNFIEYVYKNKLLQNTIHWGLGNSAYIFNLFDGFAPTIVTKNGTNVKCSETSGNMPFTANIAIKDLEIGEQNILWANYRKNFGISLTVLENFKDYFTNFSTSNEWISGVKYDFSNINMDKIMNSLSKLKVPDNGIFETSGVTHNMSSDITKDIVQEIMDSKVWVVLNCNANDSQSESVYPSISITKWQSYYLIEVSGERKALTFQRVRDKIDSIIDSFTQPDSSSTIAKKPTIKLGKVTDNTNLTKHVLPKPLSLTRLEITAEIIEDTDIPDADMKTIALYLLCFMMKRAIPQNAIRFNKSYMPKITESPAAESKEVIFKMPKPEILKTAQQVIYRYDGNIQPLFISVHRNEEYEDIEEAGEEHLVNYSNYIVQYEEGLDSIPQYNTENNQYQADYPSIGYSSMANEKIDYALPGFIQYYGDSSANVYEGERRWYDGSFMYFLPKTIKLTKEATSLSDDMVYNAFVEEVLTRMGIYAPEDLQTLEYNARFVMNYILPMYVYEFKYEKKYMEGTNIPVIVGNSFIYKYEIIFELL